MSIEHLEKTFPKSLDKPYLIGCNICETKKQEKMYDKNFCRTFYISFQMEGYGTRDNDLKRLQ